MSAPVANTPMTVRQMGLRLLHFIGVTQLAAQSSPESDLENLQPSDLGEVCTAINGGMQELWDLAPSEMRERRMGGVLHGPTQVTLAVTQYSTAISALTTWAAWMAGCTIRISGEDQDNEISNSTTLASPYMGTSGTVQATVYGDCIQLDGTIGKVVTPVEIPNLIPLTPATSRADFYKYIGAPGVTTTAGSAMPYFGFRRIVQRPIAWFVEGYHDPALPYLPRRLRVGPLPDSTYAISYRVSINPPLYSAADIDNGDHTTDPGTTFPIPNQWVESILLPFALIRYTASPSFKNDAKVQEIGRQYQLAKGILQNATRGQVSLRRGKYL